MKSALFHLLGLRGFSCGSRVLRRAKWNAGAPSAILFASPPLLFCREVWNPVLPLRARFYPRSSGLRSHARMADVETYTFGPYKIQHSEVFHTTSLSYAMVNLRPVVPDVLICPKREVKRFVDLTSDEVCDLWLTAKKVGSHLEDYHKASSLTFTIQVLDYLAKLRDAPLIIIQDGPQAGQTVPHVHIHILPRKAGDFEKNDEIYDAIDIKEKELKEKLDLDKERKDRTRLEMAQEAAEYRALFS